MLNWTHPAHGLHMSNMGNMSPIEVKFTMAEYGNNYKYLSTFAKMFAENIYNLDHVSSYQLTNIQL